MVIIYASVCYAAYHLMKGFCQTPFVLDTAKGRSCGDRGSILLTMSRNTISIFVSVGTHGIQPPGSSSEVGASLAGQSLRLLFEVKFLTLLFSSDLIYNIVRYEKCETIQFLCLTQTEFNV